MIDVKNLSTMSGDFNYQNYVFNKDFIEHLPTTGALDIVLCSENPQMNKQTFISNLGTSLSDG